jgi:uncharacterized protein
MLPPAMRQRLLGFVVFFTVVCGIIGSAHYYLYTRLFAAPQLGHAFELAGVVICAGMAVLTPTGMVASRLLPRRYGQPIAHLAYVWLGVSLLLLTSLGVGEILRLALPLDEPLRSRIIAGSAVAVVGIATAYGIASALGEVGVRRVGVTLDRLPRSLSGYKVVQLSDLHIGPTLGRDFLTRVVERVNELEPDAVVITGDLVDGSVERLRDHVAPLADLRARDGVFFVTGNHEYYSGADAWLRELERLGVRPLRNERVALGGDGDTFDLAGVDDWQAFGHGHGPDLARALEDRDADRELVLLAHQPRQIVEAAKHGVGLQLSGHTHGGQIFPWNLFVRLQQPFVAGLSRHRGTQIYVSRGTGFWGPPMRVGAPAEITLLELTAGMA